MSIEMTAEGPNRRWADRAASLYDAAYARRYRDRDNELEGARTNQALIDWLGSVCDRFDRPIDVLDLGCGTGRYFWGLRNARALTGIDASEAMLEEARRPIHAERLTALPITLFRGGAIDFEGPLRPDTVLFDPEHRRFSLVWRLSSRIRRTILDFNEAWVSPPTNAMLRARREGRAYIRAAGAPVPEDEEA